MTLLIGLKIDGKAMLAADTEIHNSVIDRMTKIVTVKNIHFAFAGPLYIFQLFSGFVKRYRFSEVDVDTLFLMFDSFRMHCIENGIEMEKESHGLDLLPYYVVTKHEDKLFAMLSTCEVIEVDNSIILGKNADHARGALRIMGPKINIGTLFYAADYKTFCLVQNETCVHYTASLDGKTLMPIKSLSLVSGD